MPKNPTLSLVSPNAIGGAPPRDLGRHGRALWDAVHKEYRVTDRGGIELLAQACGALDLVETLGEAIARDGVVVYNRLGPRAHPALKDQLVARAFVVRTLERLGVTVENVKPGPGRPPANHGWTGEDEAS